MLQSPDSTQQTTIYDALGRTIVKADQAGKQTQYFYDALGHLIRVIDALGASTSYTYDEVGDQITQTDADKHTTTFAYDSLGRRIQRTIPLGMSETYQYDAAGNQVQMTDFNGKTTTSAYDSMNRLLQKTPDPSFGLVPITFTYTPTGQRASMTDPSGSTTYTYDKRDRLLTKATPEGTLTYTYDAEGNLLSINSSNTNGTSVDYTYDALNRLSTVKDNRLSGNNITTYAYDAVGNLANYTYPNGVQTGNTYDNLNRLTHLTIGNTLASYAYTLGTTGNRLSVTELSGRLVKYTYDADYKLTNETISNDPNTINGTIGYTYDPVGNRLMRTSTVSPVPTQSLSYDANDRLTTDSYDANGSTTASGTNTYSYDYENHLLNSNAGGGMSIVYDGDGNRVSKTVGGTTTKYLIDDLNPTGYAQVLEEIAGGSVQRTYTYGLTRISETQASGTSFYGYDGHGSVRLLTNSTGAITDRYDYDAFGITLNTTGTTPNVYLYSGEQLDSSLNLYNLRARYMNQATGRFWTMDNYEGDNEDPLSLHKYLYVDNDPIDMIDPIGEDPLSDAADGNAVHKYIYNDFKKQYPTGFANRGISTILGYLGISLLRPDLTDIVNKQLYEIKPYDDFLSGFGQLQEYVVLLNLLDPGPPLWQAGFKYNAPSTFELPNGASVITYPTFEGVIRYDVNDPRFNEEPYIVADAAIFTIMVYLAVEIAAIGNGVGASV